MPPFAELNADPKVMEYFPAVLSAEESNALAARITQNIEQFGFGLWAVEENVSGDFIGFVGLQNLNSQLPIAPGVEIGWRLATQYWGLGYATEAAQTALEYGFNELQLSEVVATTTLSNQRSQAVMRRLAMRRDEETFAHPFLAENHPLRQHCVFRIRKSGWQAQIK